MNKEQIYDEQISPLMEKIIAICQEHQIAMLAEFSIPNDNDPGLQCTTALLQEPFNPPPQMLEALSVLRPDSCSPMMVTTTHIDGSKTFTAIFP